MVEFAIQCLFGIRALAAGRARLIVENLALRQQLAIYCRTTKRPKLRPRDRVFWVWLSRLWPDWRSALIVVQPDTVVGWDRQGFRLYWRWKSRGARHGRPRVDRRLQALIRRMSRENPLWGAPRIQAELRNWATNWPNRPSRGTSTVAANHRRPPGRRFWRTISLKPPPSISLSCRRLHSGFCTVSWC